MSWPLSQDYNEAIQNPASTLKDVELKAGEAVVNDMGLPIPRSGNFADVYQFCDAAGKMWAIKCFTRPVAGLRERYTAIDKHLGEAKLPVTVGFKYHAEGVRVRGKWYPMLQMEWVEGFTLNDFVRQHAAKPAYLEALFLMWVRLAKRLRQGDVAHSDLQHGNVLLVPGSRAATLELKLIDYDGMWVPELARRPSGEAGHSSYQHPARRDGAYGFDADRFPHLLIACALRSLIVGGAALWKRFDNGDNLLFREDDFLRPAESELVKTLWSMNDPIAGPLLGNLLLSARGSMGETPWLDHLMVSAEVLALTPAQRREVNRLLGAAADAVPVVAVSPQAPGKAAEVFAALSIADDRVAKPSRFPVSLLVLIALGAMFVGLMVLVLALVLVLVDWRGREKDDATTPVTSATASASAPPVTKPAPTTPVPPPPTEPEVEVLAVMPRPMMQIVLTQEWSVPGRAAPRCLDFRRDGTQLAAAPGDVESFILHDVKTGRPALTIKARVGKIQALSAAGDNRFIVIGLNNTAALWDVAFNKRETNILIPGGDLTPLSASPDGADAIGPGDMGWQVVRYGLDTGMSNRDWKPKTANDVKVLDVRYSPDGSRWVAVDESHQIWIYELKAENLTTVNDNSKVARAAMLSTSGKRLLTFGIAPELRLWDVSTKRGLHVLPGHPGGVRDALLTADERWVVSVGADKMLRIWDAATGKEAQAIELPEVASCVRLSPDGRFIATASEGGAKAAVQLWRLGK